jgi:hypothetical protein
MTRFIQSLREPRLHLADSPRMGRKEQIPSRRKARMLARRLVPKGQFLVVA